jgi:uncharacterized sulfatase
MYPYLNSYGHEFMHTPNLDAFAEESVTFLDAHCQVALCTPSRTSILTGIRPSTSGIVKIDDDWQQILPGAVSLPRHFRNNGYFTYKVGKISDPRNGGMDDAWDRVDDQWGQHNNDKILNAMDTLTQVGKPFFFAVGYGKTHDPWNPSEHSLQKYNLDDVPPPGSNRIYKKDTITDKEAHELALNFYADVTDVDSLVGEVLAKARDLRLFDNTIILIGAMDHGYSMGYYGHWGKGNNIDLETQVPLFIRIPGNKSNGKKTEGLTELVDLYPTLIDLCGLSNPPQKLEGYSLKNLLYDPDREWKKAVFTHRAYHVNDRGLKTKDYTLILRQGEESKLFDRRKDPENQFNISEDNFQIVDSLRHILDEGWINALPGI